MSQKMGVPVERYQEAGAWLRRGCLLTVYLKCVSPMLIIAARKPACALCIERVFYL